MVESKISRNVHLALYPTSAGVPAAVGHDVKGGRQRLAVLPSGTRFLSLWGTMTGIQAPVAHSARRPSVVPHGGSVLAPWGTAAAPRL
jgi:hypothetical protein